MNEYLLVLEPINTKNTDIRGYTLVITATQEDVDALVGEVFVDNPLYYVKYYQER